MTFESSPSDIQNYHYINEHARCVAYVPEQFWSRALESFAITPYIILPLLGELSDFISCCQHKSDEGQTWTSDIDMISRDDNLMH